MSPVAFPILNEIDQLKAEIDALRPLDPQVEQRVMDKLRLDWNYNSNAIEGNTLTPGETKIFLLEGLTAKGKPLKDHLDIKGHDEAIEFLLHFVRNQEFLTEKDIRAFHKILLTEPYTMDSKTPDGKFIKRRIELGQYKTVPNHVQTITGKIHYYATPEETPARMQELMNWYRNEEAHGDMHPVVLSSLFHHRFTEIHPFDDGNGRMARILSNLILMRHHFPPAVIRQANRNDYLYALRLADEGDYEALIEFIGTEVLHSMTLYKRAAAGEDVYELGDFDKKLALLTQQIESLKQEVPPEKEVSHQSQLFLHLVTPLIIKLHARYPKIDSMFKTHEGRFLIVNNLGKSEGGKLERHDFHTVLKNRFTNENISLLRLIYRWNGFTLNTAEALSSTVSLSLSAYEFKLSFFTNGKEQNTISILTGKYSDVISPEQIDILVSTIGDGLYQALENLIEKRIPKD